ncbi:hypothetical protein E2K80_11105 [Rhodophyticola sp. CCM32]|uniref:DUF6206 family protein n=1 Tax=Rhodophyticola sp. CCM32 TaxID=2916397 RepID=UPI00107FC2CF|nr:DUF6206 family protein [Rhodophyticola sp. CCM32]QBY01206.1 hypothetical protein E2K80_11105 [Rhodophyticola sp. CCM32]
MNDNDFSRAVRDALAESGEPVSRLGYFCAPFRPSSGPLADKVIKTYRGGRDRDVLALLATRHEAYVTCLREAGVDLPETRFLLLEEAGFQRPVIVQQALPPQTMLRDMLLAADIDRAIVLLDQAAISIAAFWSAVADRPERIGYHPSIRNFAIGPDGPVFFDTFPPLIGYNRAEMGKLLLRFSESPLIRRVGPVLPGKIRAIQDEWYSPAGTIVGLIGSAVRLRPEDGPALLNWGRGFAETHLSGPMKEEVLADLASPPRLPAIWTTTRRILGLEGKPNV